MTVQITKWSIHGIAARIVVMSRGFRWSLHIMFSLCFVLSQRLLLSLDVECPRILGTLRVEGVGTMWMEMSRRF